ncbi:Rieske (2Fe-2S) protein [Mesorhizobium sp. WSM4307]|uniref:Rieske (2Fe-2S) protein n=1 Tax=unclassified Mesorhizobium TaxID=325217 RepID=UPI00115F5346|nr:MULTISPECIES: Rieske (2Fe-2S) protein [unclassified Mesorhizobium]TRC75496.1 Rieske (2Fe-2S) protein [Mesorhizobium sp. WSM4315]TRC86495.1 Rieske (2Fe-2S) protein [Mesorhizobium sp. WSM4307]
MKSRTTGSWTPVALSADLPAGTVIPARTPTGPIALWRSQSGGVSAFADRCPHRGMRLSHGFVRGEALSCIYHGWSYAQAGNCVRIPAHPGLTPPEAIRVATRQVEEGDGIIWIAADQSATRPPRLDGLAPLRSLTACAGIAAIEAAAGADASPGGIVGFANNSQTIRLLVASLEDEQALIHVLVEGDASPPERIAASRAAEALRRMAEHIQRKGTA